MRRLLLFSCLHAVAASAQPGDLSGIADDLPGISFGQAADIIDRGMLGTPATGMMARGDWHQWTVRVQHGDALAFQTEAPFPATLAVRDPHDRAVASRDGRDVGYTFHASGSGLYRVVLRSLSDGGDYTIRLARGHSDQLPVPPNSVIAGPRLVRHAEARPLPPSRRDTLAHGGIHRWTVESAGSETVTVFSDSNWFILHLQLWGPDGQTLARSGDPWYPSGIATQAYVRIEDVRLDAPGTYTVTVESADGGGEYRMSIQRETTRP